ncbi:MAG TPA: RNase A-like domain-containing protein [Mycobacteriales bacterium]|nr:RNase A-like domain-containing protein [Mycobacteriales bacterium]
MTAATYTIPKVSGDADAARQIALAYRQLADAVDDARRRTLLVLQQLHSGWHGMAERALHHPVQVTVHQSLLLARVLRAAADEFDRYARKLDEAHHHHWWSLGHLLKIGAVVAVSATAIVVTVGAAGVAEAAAATAAVEGAADAVGAAAAASASAAGNVLTSLAALTSMRPLLAFALPRLLQAEWSAAATATYDEITQSRLDWSGIAENAGIVVSGSLAADGVVAATGVGGWSSAVTKGGLWTGLEATRSEVQDHRVDAADLAETFVLAGGAAPARDAMRARGWWPSQPDYRRAALIGLARKPGLVRNPMIARELATLRPSLTDLERGDVDLWLNEGPGHTLRRHVGRGGDWLIARRNRERLPRTSSYFDESTAKAAISQTLREHRERLHRWAADDTSPRLRLRGTASQPVGYTVDRRGVVRLARQICVVVGRDDYGFVITTSYPEVVARCH